jgi:hypothetical protein
MDDFAPYIYKTTDFGKTWTKLIGGLPANNYVHAVRTDPRQPGLLFAGTEQGVYVSFDDGNKWQPMQINLPTSPVNDLVVKNNDLLIATHGRSFWILDDIAPLRQLTGQIASADAHLFAPSMAYRFPRNNNTDTPLPPEEPAGQNPPDGAILYYWLKTPAPVTIEILDTTNRVVRRFSSDDKPAPPDPALNVPTYWLRIYQPPSAAAGMHRLVWDLHGAPPAQGGRGEPPISAIIHDTPARQGEWMPPGEYSVRLTFNGRTYTQPLLVKPDPR